MRGVAVGFLGLALAVLSWAVAVEPPAAPPVSETPQVPAHERADHLVCPLTDFIRSDTRVALLASRGGSVDLWEVSGGGWMSHGEADLGDTGGWIGEAPTGLGVLIAESGSGWSGAGLLNTSSQAVSGWMCGESSDSLVALGGSTLAEDSLDLILYNPYVLDSSAQLEIISELGEDTPPNLQEIFVPAGKAVKVDLDESLRLRRFLGVQVRSSPGRVALLLQQAGAGETAMIEGVAPHTDWWLPVPDLGQAETYLLMASPSGSSFTYRLDLMTESGSIIGFVEDQFLPGQLLSTPLSELPLGVTGISVSGSVPLVAGLRLEGEGLLASGPGARGTSRRWFLPGPGDDEGRLNLAWLLNPSGLPVSASVSAVAEGAFSIRVTIPPESVLPFELERLSGQAEDLPGYLVDAEQEISVVWTSRLDGGAGAYAAGAPVD